MQTWRTCFIPLFPHWPAWSVMISRGMACGDGDAMEVLKDYVHASPRQKRDWHALVYKF